MHQSGLYKIEKRPFAVHNDWSLYSYQNYLEYIQDNVITTDNPLSSLIKYVENNSQSEAFKWPVEIGSMQFLVAIFPEERIIRIASKQLALELTLINYAEKLDNHETNKLKEHAELVGSLPLANGPSVIEYLSANAELPLFDEDKFLAVHERTEELSQQLVKHIKTYRQSSFEKLSNFGLDLTAHFMLVRIHLLKFLAILPNLDHDKNGHEVKRIFLEALRRLIKDSKTAKLKKYQGDKRALPDFYIIMCTVALKIANVVPAKFLAGVIKKVVGLMATRFIAGETIDKAKNSLNELLSSGRDATIDQLGELVVSQKEADEYTEKVIQIIHGLQQNITPGTQNIAGINKAHVSIKVSALCHDFKPQDYTYTYGHIAPRLQRILLEAKEKQVFINIDAEHYHYRDMVLKIYGKVLTSTPELHDLTQTGIVVQAYLRDGYEHLQDVIALAKKRGIPMPIRLVKGAYWDAETIEAEAHSFCAPQFLNKEETDIHFRQLILKALENTQWIQLAVASHNIQDHCFAKALQEKLYPESRAIEHQCLHMTYEGLSVGLSKMGWATRNYIPVGDLLVGMAYLVRRIMENSSQVGVLTIMRSHKKNLPNKTPTEVLAQKKAENTIEYDIELKQMARAFKNIYPIRSYLKPHLARVQSALDQDLAMLSQDKLFVDEGDIQVHSSSQPELLLGKITYDDRDTVNSKIEALFQGFQNNSWKDNTKIDRFTCLLNLAELLLMQRERLTSLIMLEAGKSIDEATADVDEAIDFINFYTREQMRLIDESDYAARGVVGVIAPWNFPLAISCGMSIAALAAGNSVILKPAEQTSLVGRELVRLAHQAGIPEEVFQVSLGEAPTGKAIVEHELIVGIVFTGSKAVGEHIFKTVSAQLTSTRYDYPVTAKFAITEMGGKNAIIVTNNSELDETVSGVIYSAFAHAGQKCSAASRIIIDEQIKESFINRFVKAVNDIKVDSALEFSTTINPLIGAEDKQRVQNMAIRARDEVEQFGGRVLLDRTAESFHGHCVGPSVFELSAKTVLNEKTVASEEVFGPLVHIIGYRNLEEAAELFNATEYALTGGIFCQSQDDIDYLLPRLEAGNIYINRPNTGARVGIEPFGGFKKSGTGPKAGGKEYLSVFNRPQGIEQIPSDPDQNIDEQIEQIAIMSGLPCSKRSKFALKFVDGLIEQFSEFFHAITESDRNKLLEFREFLLQGEFDLESKQFPNTSIPGQISYNNKMLALGQGYLVDSSSKVHSDFVMELLINLIIGNGISIITMNYICYEQWKEIVELAYRCGFSNFNLNLSLVSSDGLIKIFQENNYEFVVFGDAQIDHKFKEVILAREFSQHLVKIYYLGQHAHWYETVDYFTKIRSLAINTMRHGAPMELDL